MRRCISVRSLTDRICMQRRWKRILMMIETMEKAETFEAFYGKINQIAWKRLSAKKDETIDPEKKEAVKMLREKAKKMVKDLQETCFYERPRNWQKICEIQEVPWKNWSFL